MDKLHDWLGSVHRVEKCDYKVLSDILRNLGEESFKTVFYKHMAHFENKTCYDSRIIT